MCWWKRALSVLCAALVLTFTLGCSELLRAFKRPAPTWIDLINTDGDPIHFEMDGKKKVKVKAGKTVHLKTRGVPGDCETWTAAFRAYRSIDGEERDYGTASCTSNTNDLKTVVFDGWGVSCGTGWDVIADCDPEADRWLWDTADESGIIELGDSGGE